jgi:hypothetical protein
MPTRASVLQTHLVARLPGRLRGKFHSFQLAVGHSHPDLADEGAEIVAVCDESDQ